MSDKNKKSRRDLEEAIIAKALQDEGYRKELLAKPREVVDREIKTLAPEANLPPGSEVRIIEEPQKAFYVVLPHVPAANKVELSEEDLENVAGGIIEIHDKIGDTTIRAIE